MRALETLDRKGAVGGAIRTEDVHLHSAQNKRYERDESWRRMGKETEKELKTHETVRML